VDAEWDENKRLANIAKHGIDFADAAQVFEGPIREREERRRDYREDRFSTVGEVDGRLLYVVYTRRRDRIRIISARRAGQDEREEYYKSRSQGSS
jgi:uncharacterized DUF497 family protein